jgi:uncharacterized protein YggE
MNKFSYISAGIILLLGAGLLVAGCTESKPPANETQLTVTGMSQIKVVPDLVAIYYDIQANETTALNASKSAAKIANALTDALTRLGFNKTDIQTQSYSVNPDYIYDYKTGQQISNGYRARQQIKLEFSTQNTSLISDAVDAGISSGANIDYINFELSPTKQEEYKTQALKEATANAKAKATAIASQLDRTLGRIDSISASDINFYPVPVYGGITSANAPAAEGEIMNIQPSSQDVNAQVNIVFIIT